MGRHRRWDAIATASSCLLPTPVSSLQIIYDRKITDAERQRLEGWLLWRYGLQGSLSGSHPFYNAAPPGALSARNLSPSMTPSPTRFLPAIPSPTSTSSRTPVSVTPSPSVVRVMMTPLSVSGLQIWLDLADVQARGAGNCATNWPAKGNAGVTGYVPWNG